jgi:energy-coupling factor transporter ATP-binding protein EcfA2
MMNTTEPFLYRGFGTGIRSEFALPELEDNADGAVDIEIVRGLVDRPAPVGVLGRAHAFDPAETYLGMSNVGKFLISGSRCVTCELFPDFPEHLAGFALLGPVMATIMHLRGNLVLHGSALEVDNGAVVFLGDKGAGKSTMAGAMTTAGHALITDDVIAVSADESGLSAVVRAYPTIKLSDAALNNLGADGFEVLPLDAKIPSKQRARVAVAPQRERTPIIGIYILCRGAADAAPHVDMLPLGEALPQLFAHSYMTRYGVDPFKHGHGMVKHMRQCAALLDQAPVKRLTVPGSIARLTEAVALVAQDSAAA